MIKSLVVDLILNLDVYKECNWLDHFISNTVSNTYRQYFYAKFKCTLSILHSLRWYLFRDGFSITCLLVSCIMLASISFMKFVMTFWTNKFKSPGLNIYSPSLYILQVEVYSSVFTLHEKKEFSFDENLWKWQQRSFFR